MESSPTLPGALASVDTQPSRAARLRFVVWIFLGTLVLPQLFAALVVTALSVHTGELPGPVAMGGLGAASAMLSFWMMVRLLERRTVAQTGVFAGRGLRATAAGFLLGAAIVLASVAPPWMMGAYAEIPLTQPQPWWQMTAVLALASFAEELLFRGLLLRTLANAFGARTALIASALLFGGVHALNPNSTWLAAVAIALEAGVLLSAAWLLTRSIWFPAGIHLGWNLTLGSILGLPVSGMRVPGILAPKVPTAEWAGGAFGPELGIPTLIVATGAGTVLCLIASRRARGERAASANPQRGSDSALERALLKP